ncbi:MAG TPA: zinc-binding dehydrogenase, partial [Tepidisphaeraceae bacterium]|nr:zinc-binding dehydrogenase [Tepidisphaeraceae bacterium]
QFAILSAYLLGAEKVIALDKEPERLEMAVTHGKAIPIDVDDEYVYEKLLDLTGGRGPDACIDAVGMEAHGLTLDSVMDTVKVKLAMATEHAHVLRQAINCCRKGGTVSVPGVYGGYADKIPIGAMMNKGLTIKTGQTHMLRYMKPLLERIEKGEIDPSFIITHQLPLSAAAHGYEIFQQKKDGCIKVVLKPGMDA